MFRNAYHHYALAYCVSYCSSECSIDLNCDDINCVEMFVRGLQDHWKSTAPRNIGLKVILLSQSSDSEGKNFMDSLLWLSEAPHSFLIKLEDIRIMIPSSYNHSHNIALNNLLQKLVKLRVLSTASIPTHNLKRGADNIFMSFDHLNILHLHGLHCSSQQVNSICRLIESTLTELDFNPQTSPSNLVEVFEKIFDSVLLSGTMRKLVLYGLCRSNMGRVRSVILHCSLEELHLHDCRLGYDGILFVCSALSSNTSLKQLEIHDKQNTESKGFTHFTFQSRVCQRKKLISRLNSTASATSVLLELNNFLKTNGTLIKLSIQSGMLQRNCILRCYYGPRSEARSFPQFNAGCLASGITPKLKRSYSTSDMLHQQSETVFSYSKCWWRASDVDLAANEIKQNLVEHQQSNHIQLGVSNPAHRGYWDAIFQQLFLTRRNQGRKCSAIPSFTAPDTDLLEPLSHLDPRLQASLGVTDTQRREMTAKLCKEMKSQGLFLIYKLERS